MQGVSRYLRYNSLRTHKKNLDGAKSWKDIMADIDVPAPEIFEHIEVVPSENFYFSGLMFDGGPVWPYFESDYIVRHSKNGKYVDRNSTTRPDLPHAYLAGDYLWGGRCFFHFGHLITEHTTRIISGTYRYPQAKVLFVLPPGARKVDVPRYFWSVMEWYGVDMDRIDFIENAGIVERLIVFPQAESLDQCIPPEWYLDLLDLNLNRSGIKPINNNVVYISREGQLPLGTGASAGEMELISTLERLGVATLNPATATLRQQMEIYSGAKKLIFAEGSAMHGRQLLGRCDQDIFVLRRRPNSVMAKQMLMPRCKSISYIDTISDFLQPITKGNGGLRTHGMAVYDTNALFSFFSNLDLNIESFWDWSEYWKCVHKDARLWLGKILSRPDVDNEKTLSAFKPIFNKYGMDEVLRQYGNDM